MSDVPITRETVGNYTNLNAQYSTLPGRVQQAMGEGLVKLADQNAEQAQKLALMKTSLTMKRELFRIEQDNQGNPDGMELAFQQYKEGFLKDMPDEQKTLLESQFMDETMPSIRRAVDTRNKRVDDDAEVTGMSNVLAAKDTIIKNGGGLFSKDPGAVYDAGKNIATQATIIEEISKLTKSDGTPMYTPEQRVAMLEIPKGAVNDLAAAAWAQRPDAEKLSIVEKAMKGEGAASGLPADMKADTVKPYTKEQIGDINKKVDAPSAYDELFKAAAAQEGVDWKELKLKAVVESGLDPKAVGPKTKYGQSVGLMQLTEETAKKLGVTDRTDPKQAIPAAAKLLAEHTKAAGNDKGKLDKLYYGGPDEKKWGKNTEQYAANLAAVRGGGVGETGTEFDHLTPMQKAQAYEQARDAVNINAMKFSSPAERAKIALDSGSQKVQTAATQIDQLLKTDPAAYVAQAPKVQQAAGDYALAPTPDNLNKAVGASMAMQEQMGVPAYARRVLPKAQSQAIVGEVMDAFAAKQNIHEKMIGLQQLYGGHWPRVFQELQADHLPPAAMVLGNMTYDTQRPYGTMLSTALTEGADNVYKAAGADAEKEIKKLLPDALDDFRLANERANGGTQVVNAYTDATGVLAAKLMQAQGLSAADAVQRAAGILVNNYSDFRGTFYVPMPHSGSNIAAAADLRLSKTLGDAVPFEGASDEEAEAYRVATQAHGYWVNTPEDDGLILKDEANKYVRRADGSYIRASWDELETFYQQVKPQLDEAETRRQMGVVPGGM